MIHPEANSSPAENLCHKTSQVLIKYNGGLGTEQTFPIQKGEIEKWNNKSKISPKPKRVITKSQILRTVFLGLIPALPTLQGGGSASRYTRAFPNPTILLGAAYAMPIGFQLCACGCPSLESNTGVFTGLGSQGQPYPPQLCQALLQSTLSVAAMPLQRLYAWLVCPGFQEVSSFQIQVEVNTHHDFAGVWSPQFWARIIWLVETRRCPSSLLKLNRKP